MEPEEIDKLFKERLGGLPAVPSPDAWMRLQQKMEPPQKKPLMWIYYAAASVVLLILSGVFYLNQAGQVAQPGVAVLEQPKQATPVPGTEPASPADRSASGLTGENSVAAADIPAREVNPVKESNRKASQKGLQRAVRNQARPTGQTAEMVAVQQPAPAQPTQNQVAAEPTGFTQPTVAAPALAMSANPPGNAIEVVVKRDGAQDDEEPGLRENLSKKGALLKNIYKQARNLKNGESVELAALGINKEKLQEESKEIKQKITNVISL